MRLKLTIEKDETSSRDEAITEFDKIEKLLKTRGFALDASDRDNYEGNDGATCVYVRRKNMEKIDENTKCKVDGCNNKIWRKKIASNNFAIYKRCEKHQQEFEVECKEFFENEGVRNGK